MEQNNAQPIYFGETELLNQSKTVFFCPFDVEENVFPSIREWIASLDPMAGVIVCGNSSGVERYTLRLLLKKGFAVILPLATTIPADLAELNLGWKLSNPETLQILAPAFSEHRLLLVASPENVSVSVPTGHTLSIRNRWMLEAGSRFVLAFHREFDYYDRLLLGRQVQYLSQPAEGEPQPVAAESQSEGGESQQKMVIRMGWDIYRKLKDLPVDVDSTILDSLLQRYHSLGIQQPSLLHSLMLMIISRRFADRSDFDYMGFVRQWSLQNLRPEDWQGYRNDEGRYLPSLADRCMTRMLRCMPSRNLMSLDYSRPFDTHLMHEWIDAALQRFPHNMRHVKHALKLAYYEHDSQKIDYYKQMLSV